MIEGLDPRTLTAIIALFAIMHGAALYCYGRAHLSFLGFLHIGAGYLMLAIGFCLIGFRDYLTPWVTIVLPGFTTVMGIGLLGIGLLRFFNFSHLAYQRLCYLLLAVQLSVFVYFSVIEFNARWRIAILCTIFAIQCLFLSFKLTRIVDPIHAVSVRLLYGAFWFFGLSFLGRAAWTLLFYNDATALAYQLAYISSLLTFLLMVTLPSFTIIWVASDRLQLELKRQATIDPLTKIYNRRALETFVEKEFARFEREGRQFSVILVDIDNFKAINDQYGHQVGDAVLARLSKLISLNIRKYDIFARFGGEEFVLVMPNTRATVAMKTANKLCHLVANENLSEAGEPDIGTVTVSLGVAECSSALATWGKLLAQADHALYGAKQQGKNRVVYYQDLAETAPMAPPNPV